MVSGWAWSFAILRFLELWGGAIYSSNNPVTSILTISMITSPEKKIIWMHTHKTTFGINKNTLYGLKESLKHAK